MAPASSRLRALVTGASGFIGTHLVRRLVSGGWAVRAATRRNWAKAPPGIEQVIVGDIGPSTEWMPALEDVDVVFHLAARVHVLSEASKDPEGEFRRVNVAGTARLAAQASRAGLRRIAYLSTIGVHGERTVGAAFDEDSPIAPANDYARSKADAEDALRAECGAGLEYAILRPPLVYGPGAPGNLHRLLRLIDSAMPLPLASVRNRRSLAAVENVIDALLLCAQQREAAGQAYVVADSEAFSTPEIVRILAGGMGVPARLVPMPAAVTQFAASLTGFGHAMRQLCGSLEVNAAKLRDQLGWMPRVAALAALRETASWYAQVRDRTAQSG
jgi:nucleoside-diphosphate-sugar epimerase